MAAVAAAHHGMAAARIGTVDTLLVGAGDGRRMAVRDALAGALAGRPPSYTVAIQPAAVRARGAHAGGRRDPHPLRRALWTPGLPGHGRGGTRLGGSHLRLVPRPHCVGAAAPGGLQPSPVGLPRDHVRLGTMGGAGPGPLASFRGAGMERRGVLARRRSDAPGGPLSLAAVRSGARLVVRGADVSVTGGSL